VAFPCHSRTAIWRHCGDCQLQHKYEWAQDHYEAHFQEDPHAQARYTDLVYEFDQQVPDLGADALIQACRRM